jgi:hypothetical protein
MIHLRILLREKVADARHITSYLASAHSPADRSPTASPRPVSASPARPLLARSSSRGAAAPGRRLSAHPTSSPRSSPRASFALFDRAYRPVEPLSAPSSPTPAGGAGTTFPKIQHLGLAATPGARGRSLPGSSESQVLTSPMLVKATVRSSTTSCGSTFRPGAQLRRVRIVQILMGEQAIAHPLALPEEGEDEEDWLRAWSRAEALRRLDDETRLLLAEMMS